jgi:hypothetical protein
MAALASSTVAATNSEKQQLSQTGNSASGASSAARRTQATVLIKQSLNCYLEIVDHMEDVRGPARLQWISQAS